MPEWLNGAVLKTAVSLSRYRGFESHPLRQRRAYNPVGEMKQFEEVVVNLFGLAVFVVTIVFVTAVIVHELG